MYGWIWRHLPGPLVVKIIEALVLVAIVISLLLFVVFPWVAPLLPWNSVDVPTDVNTVE
ncbi:hypothetical protein [Actinoalloteichus hymeniacidonis]|uniref:Uncharacterized protein n=1 Tax=Actinoalloteichus hymeniacidonis TaxID=340345 RepID=A0AAC9MW38_9PSEU|nr:hypothetical protein [Actinoalloteichus hymeniacidonis]AOS60870.1 hypothetical protein TL08_00100 [Actinoalloteichus hymeniacidonis]MBB5911130.1 hypothetical protein [Actinoalloteichus hymeniacidonis]